MTIGTFLALLAALVFFLGLIVTLPVDAVLLGLAFLALAIAVG